MPANEIGSGYTAFRFLQHFHHHPHFFFCSHNDLLCRARLSGADNTMTGNRLQSSLERISPRFAEDPEANHNRALAQ